MILLIALIVLFSVPAAAQTELPGLRGENYKVFQRANGTRFNQVHTRPIHYQDNGWQDISTSLTADGDNWQNLTLPYGLKFERRGNSTFMQVGPRGLASAQEFELPGNPTQVSGNRLEFSWSGINCAYLVGPITVKLECGPIGTPLGPVLFRINSNRLGSATDWQVDAQGNLTADGIVVPRPYAIGDDGVVYEGPSWSVSQQGQQKRVEFTWDDSSLPPEAFPYILDPTTVYAAATDAGIRGGPNATYSTSQTTSTSFSTTGATAAMGQNFVAGNYYVDRIFMEYDISSACPGGYVVSDVDMVWDLNIDLSTTDFDIQIRDYAWSSPIDAGNREANFDGCIAATLDQSLNTSGIADPFTIANLDTTYATAAVGGTLQYCMTSSRDASATAPSGSEYVNLNMSEATGTTNDPYISIECAAPDTPTMTPTITNTHTQTPTITNTPTATPTDTNTPTETPTATPLADCLDVHGNASDDTGDDTASASLEASGLSATVLNPDTGAIIAIASFSAETASGGAKVGTWALDLGGVQSEPISRTLSGTNDIGISNVIGLWSGVASGSRTVELYHATSTGSLKTRNGNIVAFPVTTRDMGSVLPTCSDTLNSTGDTTASGSLEAVDGLTCDITTSVWGPIFLAVALEGQSTDASIAEWDIQVDGSTIGLSTYVEFTASTDRETVIIYSMSEDILPGVHTVTVRHRVTNSQTLTSRSATLFAVGLSQGSLLFPVEHANIAGPEEATTTSLDQVPGTGVSIPIPNDVVPGRIVGAAHYTMASNSGLGGRTYSVQIKDDPGSEVKQKYLSGSSDVTNGGSVSEEFRDFVDAAQMGLFHKTDDVTRTIDTLNVTTLIFSACADPNDAPPSTPTPTNTETPTITPTDTPTATPTVTPPACCGDCDASGTVSSTEYDTCVAIFLGDPLSNCYACDCDSSGDVTIGEVSIAHTNSLCGCNATCTPTPTSTPTQTPTHTDTPTNTPTITDTPTQTATNTLTPTLTPTPIDTSTSTPTNTGTPTDTPTVTNTPTITDTPVNTNTPTSTSTRTPTRTPTSTVTPTFPPTIPMDHGKIERVRQEFPIWVKRTPIPDTANIGIDFGEFCGEIVWYELEGHTLPRLRLTICTPTPTELPATATPTVTPTATPTNTPRPGCCDCGPSFACIEPLNELCPDDCTFTVNAACVVIP